jgi:hypothetical protein
VPLKGQDSPRGQKAGITLRTNGLGTGPEMVSGLQCQG